MRYRFAAAALHAVILLNLSSSHAEEADPQKRSAAKTLFEQGKGLLLQKKHLAACEKFEESLRLHTSPSTKFQLSVCYEGVGKTATAWARADEAAADWRNKGDPRERDARRQADALAPRLSKLIIDVSAEAAALPGLEIKRNGEYVGAGQWKEPIALDPGEISVEATAPKRKAWKAVVKLKEGAIEKVVVLPLEKEPEPEAPKSLKSDKPSKPAALGSDTAPKRSKLSTPQIAAISAGAVGGAGIIVGGIFGIKAFSDWDKTLLLCPAKRECSEDAMNAEKTARTSALVANVGFITGGVGAAAAGGLWLYDRWQSKKRANSVGFIPIVGSGQYGAVLWQSF